MIKASAFGLDLCPEGKSFLSKIWSAFIIQELRETFMIKAIRGSTI